MFIPFAGQWINPAHITRMVYVEGKRLTLFMADGLDGLTETGKAADDQFKRFMTTALTYKGTPFDYVPSLDVPDMPMRRVELHDHNVEIVPFPHEKTEITFNPTPAKKGRRK